MTADLTGELTADRDINVTMLTPSPSGRVTVSNSAGDGYVPVSRHDTGIGASAGPSVATIHSHYSR